jgi:hypothetical protein|tara:strand:- start:432 stop:653 length:222 start_codon:yes stop_codon:yes gene_type:complete
MNLGPTADYIIDSCIYEIRKDETQEKIFKYIIDPLLKDLSTRYYPYFVAIIIILLLIIILLGSLLIVNIINKK